MTITVVAVLELNGPVATAARAEKKRIGQGRRKLFGERLSATQDRGGVGGASGVRGVRET